MKYSRRGKMAKKKASGLPKSPMRGVTCKKVNASIYWYASLGGKRQSFGSGKEGMGKAVAAKSKENQDKAVAKLQGAGVKAKFSDFANYEELSNWYMEKLPSVQRLKAFDRKLGAVAHLIRYFRKKRLGLINADEIERYRMTREDQGAASKTIDFEVATLRAMFNEARKRNKIPADLMPAHFLIENSSIPRRLVTEDEYNALLKQADPNFRDFLVCGWESAMRSTENCELKISKVVFDQSRIVVNSQGQREQILASYIDLGVFDTKTGARRTIPISEELREVLELRMEGLSPDDYAFTNSRGKPYNNRQIPHRLKACCERAKVPYGDKIEIDSDGKPYRPGIVFHSFRHTRVSLWVEMGFSDEIVRRASGHASLEAFKNYAKPDPGKVMVLVSQKPDKNRINSKLLKSQSL